MKPSTRIIKSNRRCALLNLLLPNIRPPERYETCKAVRDYTDANNRLDLSHSNEPFHFVFTANPSATLTVRHSAEALEQSDENSRSQTAVARDGKHQQHEQEDQGCLSAQHRELIDQMSHHDLGGRHTCQSKPFV